MLSTSAAPPSRLRVSDALSPQLVFCLPSTSVGQLAKLMAENSVREVPVIIDQRALGYVSYADVLQRFVEGNLDGKASDFVRTPVLTIVAEAPLSEAVTLLRTTGRECVVVTADGTLPIGAVTPASALRALAPEEHNAERR
jgi:predicted transcriptional regulator